MGFLLRWVFAFGLVVATYNPTEWNYVRWAAANAEASLPLVVLTGLLMLVAYVVYLRATLRSIGVLGVALVLAVFAALVWVLLDYGWLRLEQSGLIVWLGILGLSLVLGIGLTWSIIRRALTGQVDMDDVEE